MTIVGERVLLRMYLLSTDKAGHAPAYERLVQRASAANLAGATVLRGIHSFGSRGLHTPTAWHWGSAAPTLVEIVDDGPRIEAFWRNEAADILRAIAGGCATMERAGVLFYRHRASSDARAPLQLPPQGARVPDLSTVPTLGGSDAMKMHEDGLLLRIFIGESDVVAGKPLYEAVVNKARELGLAGATVLRGSLGFGANSVLHTSKVVDLSTDLPIVIELVDSEEKIRLLLPHLDAMVAEGMITLEAVRILAYRADA